MATTPSPAQAQRELAVATKTLAAAQNSVIEAQKAGRTPSPAALAAVEAATTAVKSTQLALNDATAAVTSASGKTPPSTGPGVPNSLAAAGNRNGGVSPLVDPANKQLPYNVSTPSPRTGSMLSNSSGLLDTLGAVALGAAVANPLATAALASRIGGIFKSTKDVLPASTAVPKSTPTVNPATSGTGFGDDDTAAFQTVGPADPNGVLAAEDDAIAQSDADAFENLSRGPADPNGVLAAEDDAIAQSDADAFENLSRGPADNGVLAAEDAAIAEQQAAQGDADAFENLSRGPADPNGVLAAEDAAIAAEAAAQGDADAFAAAGTVQDPNGVLAAEDAAIAEQQAAQGDADAFAAAGTVQDPNGVLAAEDAALAEQAAAQGDADAFENLSRGPADPNGVLAAEDAAIREDQIAAEDAALFDQLAVQREAERKQSALDQARAQNTIANQRKNPNNADWRVKLRLAPQANYLYAARNPGILAPLAAQGGVIFPYTPTISTSYKANYSSYDLTHSNYKGYYYQGSAVEPVTLSCPFTAQSTVEAQYLLAVIHFFKSVTKMFYGQDVERGTPPPLVYLTGLGEYQFNEHACVVQSFTYELPTDVDYIRAGSPNINNSNMLNQRQASNARSPGTTWGNGVLGNFLGGAINRLANAGVPKGAVNMPPAPATFGLNSPTYVPTKMNIAITLLPVQSRKQQSQQFSLKQYANGDLLKGGFW